MSTSIRCDFIKAVTDQVRFPFDRKIIAIELQDHIQELESYYYDEVRDRTVAHAKAIAEMGDPIEIGNELNKVHKPIWGWLWFLSKSICILLSVVVLFMVLQKGWVAFMSAQRHAVVDETPIEIFQALNLTSESVLLIADQSPQIVVSINQDKLIFDRFLLSDDGTLVILYQDVKSFDSFLFGSDHYPLRELSVLVLPDGNIIKFSANQHATYQNEHVLIAFDVPHDITAFDLQYSGYANRFTTHFQWEK